MRERTVHREYVYPVQEPFWRPLDTVGAERIHEILPFFKIRVWWILPRVKAGDKWSPFILNGEKCEHPTKLG
jgi:hypothetical protein